MRWYTLKQVCEMFHVTRPTIARWEEQCGFPPRKYMGRVRTFSQKSEHGTLYYRGSTCRVLFDADAVDAWAANRPV
ncbi:MAG: helix-turn-helix domain-containing protein [Pseudolabrys sp.]